MSLENSTRIPRRLLTFMEDDTDVFRGCKNSVVNVVSSQCQIPTNYMQTLFICNTNQTQQNTLEMKPVMMHLTHTLEM